jgi:protein-S-isoprenylcysteine O-methyltransferase Ste14
MVLAYGVAAYGLFFAVFLYLIGFSGGFLVPKHVDSGVPGSVGAALAINLALILAFGVQHSVMARPKFKRWITRYIPEAAERSTFVMATNAVLIALFVYWRPLPGALWAVEHPMVRGMIYGFFGLGWCVVLYSTFLINHFDLFGLRQVVLFARRKAYTHVPMKVVSLYRWVRNPLMLGFLITMWAVPTMTWGRLIFATGMSVYILIGIYFEERTLSRELGPVYQAYRKRTPMLLPAPGRNNAAPMPDGATEEA